MRQRSELKGARVKDEVNAALLEGSLSITKPQGFRGQSYPDCLYAWNEERAYVLKACDNGFVVVTVVAL